jgi:polyisoprenoid-binding protein YceI
MKTASMITLIALIGSFAGTVAFAETYKIDTKASKAEWLAGKKIGKFHNGEIQIKSGEVKTDKKGLITSGTVVVDMKTITNIDLKDSPEYQGKLVTHLSGVDFFKVDEFPESTFKFTSVTLKQGSKDEYTIKGDLTMLGKSQPIEYSAKISADKKSLTGNAKVKIERLKWGLEYGSESIFKKLTADRIINETFDLTLNLVAKK